MARLLKSARVAFCIHNLAYQGIFAQVRSPTALPIASQHNMRSCLMPRLDAHLCNVYS